MQKEINRMHLTRLGKILFNFSIFGVVLCILYLFIPVFNLYSLAGALVALIYIAFIWILSGGHIGSYTSFFEFYESYTFVVDEVETRFVLGSPYFSAITMALCIAAIVLLATDKREKHTAKIAVVSVFLGFAALSLMTCLMPGYEYSFWSFA